MGKHMRVPVCVCVLSACGETAPHLKWAPLLAQPPQPQTTWVAPRGDAGTSELSEEEGCGPWQDMGAKTTHFLECPFLAPSLAQDSGRG